MGEGVEQFVELRVGDDKRRTESIRVGIYCPSDRTEFKHSIANLDVVL